MAQNAADVVVLKLDCEAVLQHPQVLRELCSCGNFHNRQKPVLAMKVMTDGLQSPRGLTNNSCTECTDCRTQQKVGLVITGHEGEVIMVTIPFVTLGRRGV